jgi:hypothetical protein
LTFVALAREPSMLGRVAVLPPAICARRQPATHNGGVPFAHQRTEKYCTVAAERCVLTWTTLCVRLGGERRACANRSFAKRSMQ